MSTAPKLKVNMKLVGITVFLLLLGLTLESIAQASNLYTWTCERRNKCVKKLKSQLGNSTSGGMPMDICKLTCDDYGSLWPKPTGTFHMTRLGLVTVNPFNITGINMTTSPANIHTMLDEAVTRMGHYFPIKSQSDNHLGITFRVQSSSTDITLETDESYSLKVSADTTVTRVTLTAEITAPTYFGARHALETLSQLIVLNRDLGMYQMPDNVTITDKPVFPYRGVMLDTSRNFMALEQLYELIKGMSFNKLNVFHWHITDSHSFPMETPSRPKMTEYGAYSAKEVYTTKQMKDLVEFARNRGVKIIPELDQPAHSGFGYQWGAEDGLGELLVCLEKDPWMDFCVEPPCGQLNIANENVSLVVGDIFKDMMNVFDKDIFHMGGDEVDMRCYNSSKLITDWMTKNGYNTTDEEGFYEMWGYFQQILEHKLVHASGRNDTQAIMWTSGLTKPQRVDKHLAKDRYIIQIWEESKDKMIGELLGKGYRVIFSNWDVMYLDCGFQAWVGSGHNWCSPYKGWHEIYDNDPGKIYAAQSSESAGEEAVSNGQILGSETTLWAEQVDANNVASRVWPRAAAHAERSWSRPTNTHAEAETRMITNRNRMASRGRGILGDRLQPEYCHQTEGKCYALYEGDEEPTTVTTPVSSTNPTPSQTTPTVIPSPTTPPTTTIPPSTTNTANPSSQGTEATSRTTASPDSAASALHLKPILIAAILFSLFKISY